ncbi:MAG: hypothetical protein Q9219_004073 [cf. Caloplaca sp. 3 TL-2023]
MLPHISYSDIVLLIDLTSNTLLRLRNRPDSDDDFVRHLSMLWVAQRQLRERAADPPDPVNAYFIRRDRASIVGDCWRVINNLDIALETANTPAQAGIPDLAKIWGEVSDCTISIHVLLVATSSKTHIEPKKQLKAGVKIAANLRITINRLVPTLIARAINEGVRPLVYVESKTHVLQELKATVPEIGAGRYTEWVGAYMDELLLQSRQKGEDPLEVFNQFMEGEEVPGTSLDDSQVLPSHDDVDPGDCGNHALEAKQAESELDIIHETLRDYQGQYEELIHVIPCDAGEIKARESQSRGLVELLQRNVIEELDKLLLGKHQELGWFRKYLIHRAQEMQTNVERTRKKRSGSPIWKSFGT